MVTIPEIRKEILNAKREGDKEKSLILTTFLENAQKIAKEDKNREMTDQDLVAGVKREIKISKSQAIFNTLCSCYSIGNMLNSCK